MGGVETVRGIGYQHAQAVLAALDLVGHPDHAAIRVEGTEDIMDIEILDVAGHVALAKQIKIRDQSYTWGQQELLTIFGRWAALDAAATAAFEFVTDGRLGPTGEEVRSALEQAGTGNLTPIALLLSVRSDDAVCEILSRCTIRQDLIGVEPVLIEAEREVRSLLAGFRGQANVEQEARDGVDRLFRALSVAAGSKDPADRVISERRVLEIVGGTEAVRPEDRWGPDLREEYLNGVRNRPTGDTVLPTLIFADSFDLSGRKDNDSAVSLHSLLTNSRYASLSGTTGSGKSTSVQLLRAEAAKKETVVVLTHAESYVAGRLDSLVADGISALLDRDLPTLTGRQALNDGSVTVVIDGGSEVPADVRRGLSDELRPRSAAGHGARIVLVGRDRAALAGTLSPEAPIMHFSVEPFQREERLKIAEQVLPPPGEDTLTPRAGLSQVERALGDAAGNPMLLTMALNLLREGVSFRDRVSLYRGFIEQLAVRSVATDVSQSTAALGIVFAHLLDEDRRYASAYEWERRVTQACATLDGVGVMVEPATVVDRADRMGLVTRVGHTQTRVPLHDSFADYLAGWAHAEGLIRLRTPLVTGDEQRLLFAGELGGINAELTTSAVTDVPFLCPRLAVFDTRTCGAHAPSEIANLLHHLVPGSEVVGVHMWRSRGRLVASAMPSRESRWTDDDRGQQLLQQGNVVVLEPPYGPLKVVARMWRLLINNWLTDASRWQYVERPETAEAAADAVAIHVQATADARDLLLSRHFRGAAAAALQNLIGPRGLRAVVYQDDQRERVRSDYSVVYRQSDELDVRPATNEEVDTIVGGNRFGVVGGWGGETGTHAMLSKSPMATAAGEIRKAANQAAGVTWL